MLTNGNAIVVISTRFSGSAFNDSYDPRQSFSKDKLLQVIKNIYGRNTLTNGGSISVLLNGESISSISYEEYLTFSLPPGTYYLETSEPLIGGTTFTISGNSKIQYLEILLKGRPFTKATNELSGRVFSRTSLPYFYGIKNNRMKAKSTSANAISLTPEHIKQLEAIDISGDLRRHAQNVASNEIIAIRQEKERHARERRAFFSNLGKALIKGVEVAGKVAEVYVEQERNRQPSNFAISRNTIGSTTNLNSSNERQSSTKGNFYAEFQNKINKQVQDGVSDLKRMKSKFAKQNAELREEVRQQELEKQRAKQKNVIVRGSQTQSEHYAQDNFEYESTDNRHQNDSVRAVYRDDNLRNSRAQQSTLSGSTATSHSQSIASRSEKYVPKKKSQKLWSLYDTPVQINMNVGFSGNSAFSSYKDKALLALNERCKAKDFSWVDRETITYQGQCTTSGSQSNYRCNGHARGWCYKQGVANDDPNITATRPSTRTPPDPDCSSGCRF